MVILAVCKRCGRKTKEVRSIHQAKRYYCQDCKRILKEEARIANAQEI